MCRSVPQIDAAFTRTSTSVGPTAGTATVSICNPRAGCIFRNAFIVVAIYWGGPRFNTQALDANTPGRVGNRRARYCVPLLRLNHLFRFFHHTNLLERL